MNKHVTVIKEVMRTFDKEYKEKMEKYKVDEKEIRETYQQSRALPLLDELKVKLDNEIQEIRNKAKECCESQFNNLKELIDEIIMQKPSNDFMDTLQIIKLLGDKISKTEVEAFIEKYKNNYLEIRILITVLKDNQYVKIGVIASDDILASIDEMESNINNCFNNPNSYQYLAMLTEVGTLEKFDEYITPFINKKFIYNKEEMFFR